MIDLEVDVSLLLSMVSVEHVRGFEEIGLHVWVIAYDMVVATHTGKRNVHYPGSQPESLSSEDSIICSTHRVRNELYVLGF
jgi:hypothetical protein